MAEDRGASLKDVLLSFSWTSARISLHADFSVPPLIRPLAIRGHLALGTFYIQPPTQLMAQRLYTGRILSLVLVMVLWTQNVDSMSGSLALLLDFEIVLAHRCNTG